MRSAKRSFVLLSFMTISMLMLSGCAYERENVSLSLWGAEDDMEFLGKVTESFAEYYSDKANIIVTISEESEPTCKDTVLADPENSADVYTFAADQFDSLYRAGALLPITSNADRIVAENGGKDSGAVRAVLRDDTLYAYPVTASNGYFLYYNKAYLTDEDVRSFDRILEVAAQNDKKIAMDFSSGWYIYSFFKGAGLEVETAENGITNNCNWNSTETRIKGADVAQAMLDIATHKGFLNCVDDDFVAGAVDGSVIAGVNGTWNADRIAAAYGENYAAARLPEYTVAGENVQMCSFAGYKLMGVSAYTDQPEWAMKLAEWITNEENQALRFRMRGEGPSNVNAAASEDVLASPAIAALAEQSEYGYLQNVADTFWTPAYIFGTKIAAGNPDNTDLQQLLDEMTEGITAEPSKE